jgi:hypothetical protein
MIVTLIGSAKFENDFIEINKQLGLRGISVFSLSSYPRDNGGKDWYTDEEKILLDLVHLNKIRVSEAVCVVGDGYIGFSTAREILWADMLSLPIMGQSDAENWDELYTQLKSGNDFNTSWLYKARTVLAATSIRPEDKLR